MLTRQAINEIAQKIVAAANPNKVLLSGSHARGEADEDSELDLLVVEPVVENKGHGDGETQAGAVGIGVDVLVYSEDEFLRRGESPEP